MERSFCYCREKLTLRSLIIHTEKSTLEFRCLLFSAKKIWIISRMFKVLWLDLGNQRPFLLLAKLFDSHLRATSLETNELGRWLGEKKKLLDLSLSLLLHFLLLFWKSKGTKVKVSNEALRIVFMCWQNNLEWHIICSTQMKKLRLLRLSVTKLLSKSDKYGIWHQALGSK